MARTLAQQMVAERRRSETESAQNLRAYERRRRWSLTDTSRWLNDRGEAVQAQLRRLRTGVPTFHDRIGYWLRAEANAAARTHFDRAHAHLAALPDDTARDHALVTEVVR